MEFHTAVKAFHEHYHNTVKTRPDLYRGNDTVITVVLPKELLDYSNAAAGHSGFGAGARPVGIRRVVRNSEQALAEIFADVNSLAKFIESSEKDGREYVEQVRERHAQSKIPKPVMAAGADGFWASHNKDTMAAIKAKHKDHKQLAEDFKTMTLADFEGKYL